MAAWESRAFPRTTSLEEDARVNRYQKHVTISTGERRVIVVGDVHGCLGMLRELLEEKLRVDWDEDIVILAGDLVVKGPDSVGVVEYAMARNILTIKGNHDVKAIKAARAWRKKKMEPPKKHYFVKNLTDAQIAWMGAQPYTITDVDKKILVVHAGLIPNKSLSKQSEKDMTTMRNIVHMDGPNPSPGQPPVYAVDHVDEGVPWASLWEGARIGIHVFFGHDSKRGLQLWPLATGLDTGACKGQSLTAAVMPGHTIVSVPPLPTSAYFSNAAMAHAVAVPAPHKGDFGGVQAQPVAVIWSDGKDTASEATHPSLVAHTVA
uniref:Calcineurin-like phosphoesterase domain-containing protein n=1 Tax=Phaeomonas parva TaxID=124430 RepID=A0A6U4FBZ3_9STRA|mmetsp:Transcript_23114/g.72000  ORF Transcript_23114/g.72000 Transcript_23114/m.72000 type:complete len:320 (+) Transcript_23114:261-1220(+)